MRIIGLARISHTGWGFEGQSRRLHADIVAMKGRNLCESRQTRWWCCDWPGRIWPFAISVSSARRGIDQLGMGVGEVALIGAA
jgi:hypothetical protein